MIFTLVIIKKSSTFIVVLLAVMCAIVGVLLLFMIKFMVLMLINYCKKRNTVRKGGVLNACITPMYKNILCHKNKNNYYYSHDFYIKVAYINERGCLTAGYINFSQRSDYTGIGVPSFEIGEFVMVGVHNSNCFLVKIN